MPRFKWCGWCCCCRPCECICPRCCLCNKCCRCPIPCLPYLSPMPGIPCMPCMGPPPPPYRIIREQIMIPVPVPVPMCPQPCMPTCSPLCAPNFQQQPCMPLCPQNFQQQLCMPPCPPLYAQNFQQQSFMPPGCSKLSPTTNCSPFGMQTFSPTCGGDSPSLPPQCCYEPDPECEIYHPCPPVFPKRIYRPGHSILTGYRGHVPGLKMHGAGRTNGAATKDTCCIMSQWGNCCPRLPKRIFEQ